jgi:hypothetical protein
MTNLSDLRAAVRGVVLMPGDESFDSARRPWNFAVEQPVLAVVEAADAEDVVALVRYAGECGVAVAAERPRRDRPDRGHDPVAHRAARRALSGR